MRDHGWRSVVRAPEGMIDCHAHLAAREFDSDRDDVRRRALNAGVVAVLVVGEELHDNRRVLEVTAHTAPGQAVLLPCLGFHPDRFADDRPLPTRDDIEATKLLIREHATQIAAIGEVGLDRWVVKNDDRRRQQAALLEDFAALAIDLGLPLNVHSRSAGHYTLDLLRSVGAKRVLMHAFDGKAGHAVKAVDDGYLFSIPPSVIRSPQKQKLVRRVPIESLALESDSPVLGPDRDQRNEPANLGHAQEFIAAAHGISPERVDEITGANARRLFPVLEKIQR